MPQFFYKPLSDFIDERRRALEREVRAIEPEDLLRMPREALEEALVRKYELALPLVDFEAKRRTQRRTEISMPAAFGQGTVARTGVEVSVLVPCRGAIDLLRFSPSTRTLDDYSADTDGESSLVFKFEMPLINDTGEMARQIERQLTERLRNWPGMVNRLQNEIRTHNAALPAFVQSTVGHFVEQAQRFATLKELIDIPLVERDGDVAAAVSLAPKPIPLPAPRPNEPDPHLDPTTYELLVDRLRIMGRAIERLPGPFVDLEEESLRFFFLVVLNSQFGLEGAATGETFNAAGKTDILVRWRNSNLFVAECKVWTGEAMVHPAIDQLFGYLTVRDSRAALLFFVHGRDFTATMAKAVSKLKLHEGFEHEEAAPKDEARLIYHLPQDRSKRVSVAVLGFNLYKKRTRSQQPSEAASVESS